MQHLGYNKIGTSMIGEVLREAGMQPSPNRGKRMDWKTFFRIHAEPIAVTDFFFVPVWTTKGFVMYSVHFVIDVLTLKARSPTSVASIRARLWCRLVACRTVSMAS